MGDEAFRIIRGVYAYAPRELKAAVDEVDDSSPYWRKEKVSFSAAYGDERVPAFCSFPRTPNRPIRHWSITPVPEPSPARSPAWRASTAWNSSFAAAVR